MSPTSEPPVAPTAPLAEGTLCPDGGYDLRGRTSPGCPECGRDLACLYVGTSQIPWLKRREIGRLRAFWATFWFAGRYPRRLALEACHPVDAAAPEVYQ